MTKFRDLTGRQFGYWLVLKQGEYKLVGGSENKPKRRVKTWQCECHCGYCNNTTREVEERNLIKGKSNGCGMKSRIENGRNNHKYNKYDLNTYNYGICYTDEGVEFYFDKEDYDKIKDIYWREHRDSVNGYARGYVNTDENNIHKYIFMHNLIMDNLLDKDKIVDHISGNTLDNKKENLRICNNQKNSMNKRKPKNNTSGVKGVSYSEIEHKWKAYITYNKKRMHLGTFLNKEDAIKVRKKAEQKYFKEFNRENNLGGEASGQ